MRANRAHEALGHNRLDRGGDQEGLDAHVNEAREGARGIVRVQRAEHQVAGQGGANGDLRRLQVADFPDHDHVGVLPQDMAQPHGEGKADLGPDGDLVDALEFVFDRFLNRDNAPVHRVDGAQKRVEGGRFARAGRTGDEEDAVRLDDDLPDGLLFQRGKAELVEAQEDLAARQEPQGDALAIDRRHRGNADVNFLAFDPHVDAAVLGQAFLGDVHARHDLDAGDQRGLVALELRRHRRLVQDAVNAVADAQLVFRRLKMDVRRAVFIRLPNDLVDELDDARLLVALGDFLILAHQQFERFVLGHLVERFGADTVILLEGLFDFRLGGQGKPHRAARVEPHRVEHRGVERIAHHHLERAVRDLGGQNRVLEGDLGRDAVSGLGRDSQLGQIEIRPVERLGQLLEEEVFSQAAFPANKGQQRLLRTARHGHLPGLVPFVELFGSGKAHPGQKLFQR